MHIIYTYLGHDRVFIYFRHLKSHKLTKVYISYITYYKLTYIFFHIYNVYVRTVSVAAIKVWLFDDGFIVSLCLQYGLSSEV